MPNIFLDHQSSTPVLPEAFEAMKPYFTDQFANPSSLHRRGLKSREALTTARARFASLIHAESPEEIIFTSGGTESANLAVKGVAWANQRRGNHIVVSAGEHPAVLNAAAFLERHGFRVTRIPVDRLGAVHPEAVREALTGQTILICVQHVNHDVGTIQPLAEIGALAIERGLPLFVDAVASAGWQPVDVQGMGISLLSLTAHRFYGPKGVGILYRNRQVSLANLMHGGEQESGRRAGTENVPAIVGGGVAAEAASGSLEERTRHTFALQVQLWQGIRETVPCVALNGPKPGQGRVSTNLNISAEFTEGEGQMLSLDLAGIAVASGPTCVSKSVKISPVLQAMGIPHRLALASIVFSLGKDNTADEMTTAVAAYAKVVSRLRGMSAPWDEFQKGLCPSVIEPGPD